MMNTESIKQIISILINSKREGDYWDFKVEPHSNNADLLHDILCLANSLYKGNKYLIWGVSDPSNDAELRGLSKDQVNRKNQAQLIDFLRTKNFAGQYIPEIELHTVIINNYEIDVLLIFDRPYKPYYLIADYKDKDKIVKAHYIYTRTNDSNTPINKSAEILFVEKMWRQRFGLDETPFERIKQLLKNPKEWNKDIGNKLYAYHRTFPEFRIEFSEPEIFLEVFSFFFTNEKSFVGNAIFKYHSTTLFELKYMFCDEMRIEFPVPQTGYINKEKDKNWYYYFELDSLNGIFLQFITDNLSHIKSRSSCFPFLIFKDKNERIIFEEYLYKNYDVLINLESTFWGKDALKRMKEIQKESAIDPIFVDQIIQFYNTWKTSAI